MSGSQWLVCLHISSFISSAPEVAGNPGTSHALLALRLCVRLMSYASCSQETVMGAAQALPSPAQALSSNLILETCMQKLSSTADFASALLTLNSKSI